MDKGAKDKLAGSPGENGGGQDAQKDLHSRTGRAETDRKTQERIERRSGKRSSSAGSEKTERVGDRQAKMEKYFSPGQSPQRAVAPMEEEEYSCILLVTFMIVFVFRPHMYVIYHSYSQQRLHPSTALTDWFCNEHGVRSP